MSPTRPNAGLLAGAGVSCAALIVGAVGTWKVADVSAFGATPGVVSRPSASVA